MLYVCENAVYRRKLMWDCWTSFNFCVLHKGKGVYLYCTALNYETHHTLKEHPHTYPRIELAILPLLRSAYLDFGRYSFPPYRG